jgi:adenosylcobinamide kinase/adenosylcobinamide-phosphate guanylyltransferase
LRLAAAAQNRHVILVSNELGSGTVPEAAITRAFRDAQGLLNQWAAELAGEVILTIAGLPMYLKAAPSAEAGR